MNKKEIVILLVLPPVAMVLALAVHEFEPELPVLPWFLLGLNGVTSLACLVRAVTLLRNNRPVGYLCGAAAVIYLAFLVIVLTPAKTKTAAQPLGAGDAGLRLAVCRCSGAQRA